MVLGAILGDIIGSPYEFDTGPKSKNFPLFNDWCMLTDDTVLTIAIMDLLTREDIITHENVIDSLVSWGLQYEDVGYGGRFWDWLHNDERKPYNSYGNGSAMRISPVGWFYDTLDKTREVARIVTEVTHDHPEGIKGAECTASVIYLARNGKNKDYIKDYVSEEFGYDTSKTLAELRKLHKHDESCQDSLPKALVSFYEGNSYEDVVRNAVSLGGDTDTIAAIAGSMAEAMYGIPKEIIQDGAKYLPEEIIDVIMEFDNKMKH